MDNEMKIFLLQLRVYLLEEYLIAANERTGTLQSLTAGLQSNDEVIKKGSKLSFIDRGIGIDIFINDEDEEVRYAARKIHELREDKNPKNTAFFSKKRFTLNDIMNAPYDAGDSQIVDITHSMFPQQYGGFNG